MEHAERVHTVEESGEKGNIRLQGNIIPLRSSALFTAAEKPIPLRGKSRRGENRENDCVRVFKDTCHMWNTEHWNTIARFAMLPQRISC